MYQSPYSARIHVSGTQYLINASYNQHKLSTVRQPLSVMKLADCLLVKPIWLSKSASWNEDKDNLCAELEDITTYGMI
jgi:hypothetical protein